MGILLISNFVLRFVHFLKHQSYVVQYKDIWASSFSLSYISVALIMAIINHLIRMYARVARGSLINTDLLQISGRQSDIVVSIVTSKYNSITPVVSVQ